jgi:hypothetical protein
MRGLMVAAFCCTALIAALGGSSVAHGAAIWVPPPSTTWQWQIQGTVNTTVSGQLFDIDLFDSQPTAGNPPRPQSDPLPWVSYPPGAYVGPTVTPAGEAANPGIIATLHGQGRHVLCYMDSGAWESYRPDASEFPSAVIGKSTGWNGERWLDIRKTAWPQFEWIIVNRMLLAKQSGCDGIEPDQNNPVGNDPGFSISYADEDAWYLEVAKDAHALGLTVVMKNGIELLEQSQYAPGLVAAFDGDINEQCYEYQECEPGLGTFVSAGKWVGEVEYTTNWTQYCPVLQADGFMAMHKGPNLYRYRVPCWSPS